METSGKMFVERIDLLLAERKITKAQLKRDLNLSRNSIDNWKERGNLPAADVAVKIAKYLNTTVEHLLYGVDFAPEYSFNTRKIIYDFLELTPENQKAVSLMINSLLASQVQQEKKVSD